jgi:hypothetical protein
MRGRTRCRTHLDKELGPRRGGAPHGNLNALRHAGYSAGLPEPDMECLVAAATAAGAEDLAFQFGLAIRDILGRTGDPFRTLLTLDRVLDGLIDCVATQLFQQELDEALAPIPPLEREGIQRNIDRLAARDGPRKALIVLRRCRRDWKKKKRATGTTNGTGNTTLKNILSFKKPSKKIDFCWALSGNILQILPQVP